MVLLRTLQAREFGGYSSAAGYSSALSTFPSSLAMSTAEDIARSLNRWAQDGLDLMGGADSHAFTDLLDEYFDILEQIPQSKYT